jgi:hypothetical protein
MKIVTQIDVKTGAVKTGTETILTEQTIHWVPIEDLKPSIAQGKTYHSTSEKERALHDLVLLIKSDKITTPLIISQDYEILDGYKRYLVAQMLEFPTVPCIIKPRSKWVIVKVSNQNVPKSALYIDGKLITTKPLSAGDILKLLTEYNLMDSMTRFVDINCLDDVGQFPRKLKELPIRGSKVPVLKTVDKTDTFIVGRKK